MSKNNQLRNTMWSLSLHRIWKIFGWEGQTVPIKPLNRRSLGDRDHRARASHLITALLVLLPVENTEWVRNANDGNKLTPKKWVLSSHLFYYFVRSKKTRSCSNMHFTLYNSMLGAIWQLTSLLESKAYTGTMQRALLTLLSNLACNCLKSKWKRISCNENQPSTM